MKNLSDEKFEQLLTDYCEAQPEQSFVYDPDREGEKIIPFVRYRKQLVAAASLVLVSVLSITIYFLLGNKISTPIAVAPSPQSATTPSAPTGESDSVFPNDTQDNAEATEAPSVLQQIINSIFRKPSETRSNSTSPTIVSPTEKGKSNGRTQPSETTKISETQSAAQKPSSSPTLPIIQPTQPDVQPTQAPVRPTEPPKPTIPIDPPSNDPTEGSGDDPDPWLTPPTEGGHGSSPYPGEGESGDADITAYVKTSLLNSNNDVFCKIYDDDGVLFGSTDLYDASHRAYVSYQNLAVTEVYYYVSDELLHTEGYYTYVFYNDKGTVLDRGQFYIKEY